MKRKNVTVFKKQLALLLAVLMLSGMLATVSFAQSVTGGFQDVSEDDWFWEDVAYVTDNALMQGVAQGVFSPEKPLTRAMCVTILYRLAGEPDVSEVNSIFADVPDDAWYACAAEWARSVEITNGRKYGYFFPDANITRAELVTMLLRYAHYATLKLPQTAELDAFSDQSSIPDYAKTPVSLLCGAEIVQGKPGNRFDPGAKTTRAEAAALLHRFAQNTVSSDWALLEKYGLELRVSAWIDRMPMADSMSGTRSYFSVVFKKTDATTESLPEITVCANIGADQYELVQGTDRPGEVYFSDATLKVPVKEGEILVAEITVTVGGETGAFYVYPTVEVTY